ncbi:hypothetical protein ACFL59_06560 [Planctomycetota bacterium]
MAEKKPNPLKIHAIVVIVVGVGLTSVGAWGAIQHALEQTKKGGIMSGIGQANRASMMQSQAGGMTSTARGLARPPTSLSGLSGTVMSARSTWMMAKRFLSLGWILLCGLGLVFTGIMMLKQKNWARIASFGGLGFCVYYFAGFMGSNALAAGRVNKAIPIACIVLISVLAAKFMWDVMLEKFEPAT